MDFVPCPVDFRHAFIGLECFRVAMAIAMALGRTTRSPGVGEVEVGEHRGDKLRRGDRRWVDLPFEWMSVSLRLGQLP